MAQEPTLPLAIAARFKGLLVGRFGARVAEVRVFGSRARGDAHEESDLDVLVLVRDLTPAEKIQVFELAAEVGMEAGIGVSTLTMTPAEFERLRSLEARIALDIDREGISA